MCLGRGGAGLALSGGWSRGRVRRSVRWRLQGEEGRLRVSERVSYFS